MQTDGLQCPRPGTTFRGLHHPADGRSSRVRHSNFIERFGETCRRVKAIVRLPDETSCVSLVWAVLDRASRGRRGLAMAPDTLWLLQDVDRAAARRFITHWVATLPSWRTEILAHHTTGASNGPTEGRNVCIKKVKRDATASDASTTTASAPCCNSQYVGGIDLRVVISRPARK